MRYTHHHHPRIVVLVLVLVLRRPGPSPSSCLPTSPSRRGHRSNSQILHYYYYLTNFISFALVRSLEDKSSSGDEISERDVTYRFIWLLVYHWTIRHIYSTPEYFWSNAYISNGRRFTESALRILLLSIFRVSSINYSFVCSLPIYTRSPANAEGPRAHCQSKSCKMFDRLHLKRPATCEWPSRSFKVTAVAAIWLAI